MHGSEGASVSDEFWTVRQDDAPDWLTVVGSKSCQISRWRQESLRFVFFRDRPALSNSPEKLNLPTGRNYQAGLVKIDSNEYVLPTI